MQIEDDEITNTFLFFDSRILYCYCTHHWKFLLCTLLLYFSELFVKTDFAKTICSQKDIANKLDVPILLSLAVPKVVETICQSMTDNESKRKNKIFPRW